MTSRATSLRIANRRLLTPFVLLCLLLCISLAIGTSAMLDDRALRNGESQRILLQGHERIQHDETLKTDTTLGKDPLSRPKNPKTLRTMLEALDVLQQDYFEPWQGIWPTSIDWTSAIIGTYLSAALTSLSTSFDALSSDDPKHFNSTKANENLINKYFSQLVASYFGQDAFSLRSEAYDDMLWVVLGWVESIKFINIHSAIHYKPRDGEPWYGTQWIPAFAHRARLFWDLASQGWDTSLCDGGMIWSPYLVPYKNAITNELFITASISMYLYFPGDTNTSPFSITSISQEPAKPHDPKYLVAAIEAYRWLKSSNMTDSKGLYVDGYHVSGWSRNHPNGTNFNTRCDARNEMVYTYNQGVLLSGQRGLWEATGARSYLEEGHVLIQDVIRATGYDLQQDQVMQDDHSHSKRKLGKWHGLGRMGVLEDVCDAQGYCSQDAQTFKGIFFHHLTLFCGVLPPHFVKPEETVDIHALNDLQVWHDGNCKEYGGWLRHNAEAAVRTRDEEGRFGMWWGAPKENLWRVWEPEMELPDEAVDYRNQGVPRGKEWRDRGRQRPLSEGQVGMDGHEDVGHLGGERTRDANDRGRGRTVETQGGGLSVLRALWEVVDTRKER